ncbi:alpha/beta hydrolase [Companilactobacillus huachuanensis]|uniref:Alpha/beta hydrolase n=1 Tax=Companilactobacillus huachuanensis TaxID=2559914 RepID=A0ABW1RN78_9LACO|nr:alpha/beta hydrolase [Companilactobacillus huachuanensis]
MKKIKLLLLLLAVILAGYTSEQSVSASDARQMPTLFFHGFGGTAHSMDYLINKSQRDGYATRTLTIVVTPNGKVITYGKWQKDARNPEIQVLFENNHESDYHHTAVWIDSILKVLHKRYGVTRFNAVAHSWGNNAIMYYLENYSQKKNQPQIDSLVNIAAPMQVLNRDIYRRNDWRYSNQLSKDFNSYVEPNSTIRNLRIRELNIMGQLSPEDHFDKAVPVSAAKSLRRVFKGPHQSYESRIFTGPRAEHSALTRRNPKVLHDIEHFLWVRNSKKINY